MATEPFNLTERNIPAASTVACSGVTLDARIFYPPAPDARTTIQKTIDQHISMPDAAARVMLGDLELYYPDHAHLAGISMYFNFANAQAGSTGAPQVSDAPPVFLTFPDLAATDRDVIKYPVQWRALIDRSGHALRFSIVGRQADRFVAIADRIFLGLDAGGAIAAMTFTEVDWQD